MISAKTVQITKYYGLFLLLLIFFPPDLAVSVTVSSYLAINSKSYAKLVIVSLVIFLADAIFRNFDISIRFISDLALDSYILLLASLFIYFKSQNRIPLLLKSLGESHQKLISPHTLMIIGISSVFSLLLAPIIGIPYAVISGYVSFSYFSKHFEGRYAYIAGLVFLFFCPFLVIAKKDNLAENFAIISFYFLIIGTVQETIRLAQEYKGQTDVLSGPKSFIHSVKSPQSTIQFKKFIIIAGICGLIGFVVTYFSITGGKLP